MKNKNIILTFCFLLFLTSCFNRLGYFTNLTGTTLPPTKPDNVQLYFAPDKPDRPYEPLGYVNIVVHSIRKTDTTALNDLKIKAAQNGADAVLNITINDAGRNINTGT